MKDMKSSIENYFKKILVREIEKENNEFLDSKFKVKVEPFDQECRCYTVKYSFTSGKYWDVIQNNSLSDKEFLCSCRIRLWWDFDEAVKFAKSLNTEKVKEYIENVKNEYDNHISKLKLEREKRNKTFEL